MGKGPGGDFCQGLVGEQGHDPHKPVFQDKGMTGKGHHPFPLCPFLIVDTGITDNIIGEMGLPVFRDKSDLVFSKGNTAVSAVDMIV